MTYLVKIFLLISISFTLLGQSNDSWTSFFNKDSTLIGFKDKNGVVTISPKFSRAVIANKFDNIIAVEGEVNGSYNSYYLTKSGKIIGKDSLFFYDNVIDCENEGFIRFRDNKADKVGMLDKNGDIVVPAEYNSLTKSKNNMAIALKGAEKKYFKGGEHYSWIGGQDLLINMNNKVLIEDFKDGYDINFYSLIITTNPNTDSVRQSFKAVDGQYYSFINFKKEFKAWINSTLLKNFSKENLLEVTFNEVTFSEKSNGWKRLDKKSFIDRNFKLIKSKLLELNSPNCNFSIFDDELNEFMFSSDEFKNYYDNCGGSKYWIYPVKNIVITHEDNKDSSQDHFEFLKTENGYKLISMSIDVGK